MNFYVKFLKKEEYDLTQGVLDSLNNCFLIPKISIKYQENYHLIGLFCKKNNYLISFIFYLNCSPQIYEIVFLATNINFSNKGYMNFLFQEWVFFCQKNGIKNIWLEVHEDNVIACNFYKKMDFKLVGKRKAYYSDNKSALLYNLDL